MTEAERFQTEGAEQDDSPQSAGGKTNRAVQVGLVLAVTAVAAWLWATAKPPLVIPEGGGVSEWPAYGNDPGGSRYAALSQITPGNVMHLERAWVYRTGEDYTGTPYAGRAAFEATPILVDGTLYLSTQSGRIIALDPETGAEQWVYDPQVNLENSGGEFTSRGVSAWLDDNPPEGGPRRRIFMGTLDARLICLDAATGKPCADFGDAGEVNMAHGVDQAYNYELQVTSPPAIVGDLVIIGSAIGDNQRTDAPAGVVRAYHARTGELIWAFDPIPRRPSHPAWSEWRPYQASNTGAANAWSILSADPERDLVFVPTGSASPDYYGGKREGSNLYANSVVALRASTGEVVWHFQVVHHDVWDYDVPSQPTLITIHKDGEEIPALVQATKLGHLFFFNRETGEALFPIEEREVPKTDVDGEKLSPTQPFPTKPRALIPQKLTEDDLWGIFPGDKKRARKRLAELRNDGLFTPPSLQGSLHYPGVAGGINWGSVAFDPNRNLVVLNTTRVPFIITLIPEAEFDAYREAHPGGEYARQKGTPYGMRRETFLSASELPITKPPWGTLAAVDAVTGDVKWEVPLGTIRDLSPIPIPIKWGTPTMGGPIVTESGLIFISATMDYYLRAFDTETGKELWKGRLPAGGQATPMTYRLSDTGKQYVVICAGGHGRLGTKLGDYVIAFALPTPKS